MCPLLMFQGPLQLFSWSDSLAGATFLSNTPGGAVIHACSDLAQLAMWLGVGKVRGDRPFAGRRDGVRLASQVHSGRGTHAAVV